MALKCLLEDRACGPQHPAVKRGLAFLLRHVRPDGGIYVEGEGMRNYHTSVALMALSSINDPSYDETVKQAQAAEYQQPEPVEKEPHKPCKIS